MDGLSEEQHRAFIREAVEMATENVASGKGGPFGAIIVKDRQVIGRGVNRVTERHDPTAHAEVMAIRDACTRLGHFRLEGADIYTSCEPCPMCLGALYWAHIRTIYYAAVNTDAARAGFDDSFIYKEIPLPHDKRAIPIHQLECSHALRPFDTWVEMENKIEY